MPPVKAQKGQEKAQEKQKLKVAEDKTFGLKNKNKSKVVQAYIKSVQDRATGKANVSQEKRATEEHKEKEEKKKVQQQKALLASLFKGTENVKKLAEDEFGNKFNVKDAKEEQKIDLWSDPRTKMGYDDWTDAQTGTQTKLICRNFLEAANTSRYGWFWICPNGGNECKYRHCLPPNCALSDFIDPPATELGAGSGLYDEDPIEEIVERERMALTDEGTQVTFELFQSWLKRRKEGGGAVAVTSVAQTANATTGRALFSVNPNLFVDDDAAAEDVYDVVEEEEPAHTVVQQPNLFLDADNLDDIDDIDNIDDDVSSGEAAGEVAGELTGDEESSTSGTSNQCSKVVDKSSKESQVTK